MLKKILALVMCLVIMCGMSLVANAKAVSCADEYTAIVSEGGEIQVQPRYNYTATISTSLNNSSGKAQCVGSVLGYSGTTTRIHLRLILQKKNLLWWSDVDEWYTIANTYTAALSKTVAVESGTYRVKLVATVYAANGSEEVENYSQTNKF